MVRSLDCFVVDVGEQMDGGRRNASQTKKMCGSLYLDTVAFGSRHESEDRVQMRRIHKLMAVLLVAPVCLGLSLRSGRQWSQDALVAERTATALPVRQELVLHEHVQDLGVGCLQELLDGAMENGRSMGGGTHVYIYIYTHVYTHTTILIYIYTYVYIHITVYMYIYIYDLYKEGCVASHSEFSSRDLDSKLVWDRP